MPRRNDDQLLYARDGVRAIKWLLSLGTILAMAMVFAGSAFAAGNPDITLSKSTDGEILFGEESTVTLSAENPGTNSLVGYNLSFRDVLPVGVSYAGGVSPASAGAPRIITNQPGPGQTTLIWENVSDLTPGSSFDLTFQVAHDDSVLAVGDSYLNQAGAYLNCDPRYVPDFNASGAPVQSGGNADCSGTPAEESYTGWATASANTDINAIEIEKDEPSPEGELLRGLHNHQTVYTLTVRNNLVNPSNNLRVEDYLPAGLEFLGCGDVDNTTDAPTNPGSPFEYPGSGPIDGHTSAPADCVAPDIVETVENPPGLPAGVYTHVVWEDLGNLAPGGEIEIRYVAAIPIRENTMNWTGVEPDAASGEQAANLDNNSGPETTDEQALTNYAIAGANYQAPSLPPLAVTDTTDLTRTAEDIRILKSVAPETFGVGIVSTWTLQVDTGEYRYFDDVAVEDTLGNGYCPLGTGNLTNAPDAQDAACDSTGDMPSPYYTSAQEQSNGTWELVWDSSSVTALERIQPSSGVTITFPTMTRSHYQSGFQNAQPILANDSGHNDVSTEGAAFIVCAPGAPDACAVGDPEKIDSDHNDGDSEADISDAEQEGDGPTIDKRVSPTVNGDCATVNDYADGIAPIARPGDSVCWRLTVTFPSDLETGKVNVTDFIPPGTTYTGGSTALLPDHNATIVTTAPPEPEVQDSRLSWRLDSSSDSVSRGDVFDVVFAVQVERIPTNTDGDILDNLMKMVYSNTAGQTFPLRDQASFELAQPEIDLVKGVRDIDDLPAGGRPANVDGGLVSGNDVVTYRVDVTNDGSVPATNTQVWDVLPAQITCAMVSSISNVGTCNSAEDRIEWSGLTVPADGSITLTYDVTIPDGLSSGEVLTNEAGVRQFESDNSEGDPYINIPSNNIDPDQEDDANAPSADDPSDVTVEELVVDKSRTTATTQPGNSAADQATIGEIINYRVEVTIPEGTSLYGDDTALVDNLSSRFVLVAGSAAATLDNGNGTPVALPTAGLTLSETTNGVQIDFPNPYNNLAGSDDDVIVLTYQARVADVFPANNAKGNSTQYTLRNTATLSWDDGDGNDNTESDNTDTTIVEPNVSIGKSADATGLLTPGDIVNFTLTASNGSGARVSQANDSVIVDTIPVGLDPVNGTTPVADGGTVNPDGGIWDEDDRTITWPAFDLAPGASVDRHYAARVSDQSLGSGLLVNTAVLTTTSLPGTPTGERDNTTDADGYEDQDQWSGQLISGGIIKASSPESATIGQLITQTLTVTIPAGIGQYDATVVDDLPDGLLFDAYLSATCTAGCTSGPSTITPTTLGVVDNGDGQRIGWFFGDVAPHSEVRTVVLTYRTFVAREYKADDSAVADGDTLTNEADLLFNLTDEITTDPTSPPDPGDFDEQRETDAETEVIEPSIVLDKDVSGDPDDDDLRNTQPGDSYTYSIKVTNNGTAPAYDVVVTDMPDVELTNVVVATNAAWQITDNWTAGDRDIAWLIPGPIAPNDTVTLTYTADLVASSNLTNGQEVDNTADVPEFWGVPEDTREDPGNNPGIEYNEYDDVDDDSVKLIVRIPDLELDKTTGAGGFPDDAPASIEQPFSWRIVITNPNTPSSLLGVDLTDTLPPNWTYVPGSAQFSGTGTLTPGGQVEPTSITEDDAGDVLVWGNIADLEGGETVIVEFEATPDVAAALNPGVETQHLNDAEAIGEDTSGSTESGDGPYSDDDDATATLARPDVDLAITKVARDDTPIAGTETVWDLVVTNNGPETSPSVQVSDVLPAGLTYVSAVPEQGTCAESPAGTVACDLGVIRSGDSVAIVLTTLVGADQNGQTLVNPAEVTDPTIDDSDPSNNDDEDEVTPDALADVSIEKSRVNEFVASQRGVYRLTVKNAGPSVAESVVVKDTLPANLSLVEARTPVGTCTATGQAIECALGDMAPGAEVVIEVEVNILSGGETANSATVESITPDPDPGNNEDGDTTNSNNTDLAIEKTGPVNFPVGKNRQYTLKVTNVGNTASGGKVTVTDWVPNVLAPLAAAGDGWTCGIAGQLVTCERGDSLAPGDSFPLIRITVKPRKNLGFRPVTNTAEVSLASDPNEANNKDSVTAERGAICTDGKLVLKPRFVWVGRQTRVVIRVVRPDRGPAAGIPVTLRGNGKDGAAKRLRKARSNSRGEVSFVVRATGRAARWVAAVGPCGLKEKIVPRVQANCQAFQANPRVILPGQTTVVRIRLKAPDGGPLIGVQVTANGPGVDAKARTNRKGLALLKLAPTAPGTITVRAPGATKCAFQVGAADVGSAGEQLTG